MNKFNCNENRFARLGLAMMLALLASRCGSLALSFYALYFIGGALLKADFYACAASPLLLVIIAGWRKLNEIYESGEGFGQRKTTG